jgi:hypothetical protein
VTERKPSDIGFETWIDRQIREATERGEFDNLPGTGKPIPGQGRPDDELWWVKEYLRREGLPNEALLPASLRLRKEIERLPETVKGLRSEQAVRDVVADLNLRIANWLRTPSGPQVHLAPVKVDDVVRQWHADRRPPATTDASQAKTGGPAEAPPRRVRWWRRRAQ